MPRKSLQLFIFISSLTLVLALTMKFEMFKLMTSSTGVELCAIDDPSEVLWLMVGMVMKCGLRCVAKLNCVAFNFNEMNGKCDLYTLNYPQNYSAIPGCNSYISGG